MLKRTFEFTDFKGNKRKQDFWFNLSKSELMRLNLTTTGGLEDLIDKIVQTQDTPELCKIFEKIILESYGVISDDGMRFIKSEELRDAFSQTPVYDMLFMELSQDDIKAAEFINGIVPEEVSKQFNDQKDTAGMNPALAAIQGKQIPLAIPQASEDQQQ